VDGGNAEMYSSTVLNLVEAAFIFFVLNG